MSIDLDLLSLLLLYLVAHLILVEEPLLVASSWTVFLRALSFLEVPHVLKYAMFYSPLSEEITDPKFFIQHLKNLQAMVFLKFDEFLALAPLI